jgi:serine/threonine protein kinase
MRSAGAQSESRGRDWETVRGCVLVGFCSLISARFNAPPFRPQQASDQGSAGEQRDIRRAVQQPSQRDLHWRGSKSEHDGRQGGQLERRELTDRDSTASRRMAVKAVKPGMDSKNVIARFEAERQALALMDHPNIAHVFDAGATTSGRPYFVMELIRGIKITDYCDENSLTTIQRLELFTEVCNAVQHAHQKGIIHRDIKPSNILVSSSTDGKPLPKIIDFGIAKAATGQRLTDNTVFTAFEMLIGTPAYMSAEQAALTSVGVFDVEHAAELAAVEDETTFHKFRLFVRSL